MKPDDMLRIIKSRTLTTTCEASTVLGPVLDRISAHSVKECPDCHLYMGHTTYCKQKGSPSMVADYSVASEMTVLQCLAIRKCPVCGADMNTELDLQDQRLEYFFCSKSNNHIYEYDKETGTADRIPM